MLKINIYWHKWSKSEQLAWFYNYIYRPTWHLELLSELTNQHWTESDNVRYKISHAYWRMAYDLSRPIGDKGRLKKCLPTLDFLLTRLVPFVKRVSVAHSLLLRRAIRWAGIGIIGRLLHKWSIVTQAEQRWHFGRVCALRLPTSWQTSLQIESSQLG